MLKNLPSHVSFHSQAAQGGHQQNGIKASLNNLLLVQKSHETIPAKDEPLLINKIDQTLHLRCFIPFQYAGVELVLVIVAVKNLRKVVVGVLEPL